MGVAGTHVGSGEAQRTELLFWLDDRIVRLGSWRGPPPTITASHDPLSSPPVIFVESRTQRTTLRFEPVQRQFLEGQPAVGLRTPRAWAAWRPVLERANAAANDFDDLSGQAERRRRRTWLEAREDLVDHGRGLRSRIDAHRASIDALATGPIRFRLLQECNAADAEVKRIEKTATCLKAALLPEWRRDTHRTELSPADVDAIARAIRAAAGVP